MASWDSSSLDSNYEDNSPYGGPYVAVDPVPPIPPDGFMFLDETGIEIVHLLGIREVDQLLSHYIDFHKLNEFLEMKVDASEKIIHGLKIFLRQGIFAKVIREEAESQSTGITFLESSNFEASQSCAHTLKENIYKVLTEQSFFAFERILFTFNDWPHSFQLHSDGELEEIMKSRFWQSLKDKDEYFRPLVKLVPSWMTGGSDSSEDPVDSERQGPRFQVTGRNERPVGPTGPTQGFR